MKRRDRDQVFAAKAAAQQAQQGLSPKRVVTSLLDAMKDGTEYESLIEVAYTTPNLRDEVRRAIADLEAVRQRPVLVYAANVLRQIVDVPVSIVLGDDLPFSEMVSAVTAAQRSVDIVLVSPGGLAQQVSQFVHRLRPRFDKVGFLLPHMALSAGTIWALSGNEVWMDERAFLGPIDPQVPGRDGRMVPAQALLTYLEQARKRAETRATSGLGPDVTDLQILRTIDPKEIGNAMAASEYSIQLASSYLENYKFSEWTTHSNGQPVTPAERRQAAINAATKLCSHDQWKIHSHGISRDVAWRDLRIKIGYPEQVPGFHRALRRLWTLLYWVFENSTVAKVFVSSNYSMFRIQQAGITK